MVAGLIPGAAHRRPATSTCSVVSTPEMEDESYRLRTTALLLTAAGPCCGITADMVAEAVEHDQVFPRQDICDAPCLPEDFLLVLSEGHQRDLVFERCQLVVAGVKFLLRPWFPPSGGNKVWRFYYRVAIEVLPLNAWSWDNVQEVVGKKCRLDLIERQSTTKANVSALFVWVWAWDPDLIPRASDFNVISRPDIARPRRSLPEGTPAEQGKEGPHFSVLVHLDMVKDYSPVEDEDLEWPRIFEHKDWRMGCKDGVGVSVVGHATGSGRGQKPVGKDMQQKPEDSISDALSAADVQVQQTGPAGSPVSVDRPPDLSCDVVQGEGYAAQWGPPGELLPLFSATRLTSQACGTGLFNADAPHDFWVNTCQLTSAGSRCYELSPLPPSLESQVWDWPVFQQPSLVQ
ncbi:hypothetical protein ZWY2020_024194 [Hordeum vulgare]|nr:hypothetical protein ZWY2020_024194 [Hordeum vulgare]